MPHLQLNASQFPLFVGETHVGRGVGADILIPGSEGEETALIAVLTLGDDNVATISGASAAYLVTVNGVALGKEPSPLQHGDRIELAGVELRFADEVHAMVTSPVPSVSAPATPWQRSGAPARTGGRLISLIDGREYLVGDGSITIGRDAGCDVVVAVTEVSRRHARIESSAEGYLLVDTSTNGVLLNGERITGPTLLGRGDTIRVGPEEFRFHADTVPVVPPPIPTPRMELPPPVTFSQAPAGGASPRRPVLATLEVINEGPTKGHRFDISTPLTHVGRGSHNDIPISDDSVSDLHAKVQLRDDGWYVVDMGSTNGTYVAGQRVVGEARIIGNADLRFGGIKFVFRDVARGRDAPHGTRVIVGLKGTDPVRAGEAPAPSVRPTEPPGSAGPGRIRLPRPLLIVLVALALVIFFFILQGA